MLKFPNKTTTVVIKGSAEQIVALLTENGKLEKQKFCKYCLLCFVCCNLLLVMLCCYFFRFFNACSLLLSITLYFYFSIGDY